MAFLIAILLVTLAGTIICDNTRLFREHRTYYILDDRGNENLELYYPKDRYYTDYKLSNAGGGGDGGGRGRGILGKILGGGLGGGGGLGLRVGNRGGILEDIIGSVGVDLSSGGGGGIGEGKGSGYFIRRDD